MVLWFRQSKRFYEDAVKGVGVVLTRTGDSLMISGRVPKTTPINAVLLVTVLISLWYLLGSHESTAKHSPYPLILTHLRIFKVMTNFYRPTRLSRIISRKSQRQGIPVISCGRRGLTPILDRFNEVSKVNGCCRSK